MVLRLAALLLIATVALGEHVPFKPCHNRAGVERLCKITNVAIEPCPEAARNATCKIKKGHPASIAFDFELDFDPVGELKSRAYWTTVLADLPFVGMDTDACKMTACPVTKNKVNHYNYTLDISKTFPSQTFDTKYKVWEDKAGPEKECCILFKMKLV